jgi:hypothetical protein
MSVVLQEEFDNHLEELRILPLEESDILEVSGIEVTGILEVLGILQLEESDIVEVSGIEVTGILEVLGILQLEESGMTEGNSLHTASEEHYMSSAFVRDKHTFANGGMESSMGKIATIFPADVHKRGPTK